MWLLELRHSLLDVRVINSIGVAWVLVLPLWFTLPDRPVLLLEPSVYTLSAKIQDSSLVLLAADLLVDPLFGFQHVLLVCLTIPQLKQTIFAVRQSL